MASLLGGNLFLLKVYFLVMMKILEVVKEVVKTSLVLLSTRVTLSVGEFSSICRSNFTT